MKTVHDSETKARGQQVITVCAVIHKIIDDVEHVVLFKRADTKKFMPGIFELLGGHLDFGETLHEGLRREVMEEIGRDIRIEEVCHAFTYMNEVKGSHSVEVVFLAALVDESEPIQLHPEDHSAYVWVSEADVRSVYESQDRLNDEEYRAVTHAFSILHLATRSPSWR